MRLMKDAWPDGSSLRACETRRCGPPCSDVLLFLTPNCPQVWESGRIRTKQRPFPDIEHGTRSLRTRLPRDSHSNALSQTHSTVKTMAEQPQSLRPGFPRTFPVTRFTATAPQWDYSSSLSLLSVSRVSHSRPLPPRSLSRWPPRVARRRAVRCH